MGIQNFVELKATHEVVQHMAIEGLHVKFVYGLYYSIRCPVPLM